MDRYARCNSTQPLNRTLLEALQVYFIIRETKNKYVLVLAWEIPSYVSHVDSESLKNLTF